MKWSSKNWRARSRSGRGAASAAAQTACQACCVFRVLQLVSNGSQAAAGSSLRQPGKSAQVARRRCALASGGVAGSTAGGAGGGAGGAGAAGAAAVAGGVAGFSGVERQAATASVTSSAARAMRSGKWSGGSLLKSELCISNSQGGRDERIDVVPDRSGSGRGIARRHRLADLATPRCR